jgi:tripartite ATP-independent transporter DctM subunit
MGSLLPAPMNERLNATFRVWPVVVIFLLVVGGIYGGIFTPTEGAAVGAFGTGIAAWLNGGLNRKTIGSALLGTATASAMIFMIVLGAGVYNTFLALSQLPQEAAAIVVSWGLSPWMVLASILVLYVILGCFMDSLSMILLTIPVFFPIVSALDFGLPPDELAIWFGILVLIVVEVGLITPPVGMNLFVINSLARDTPITQTYRAIMPFVLSDLLRTCLLVAFPSITLFVLRF